MTTRKPDQMTRITLGKVIIQVLFLLNLDGEKFPEAFYLEPNQLGQLTVLSWQSTDYSIFFLHFEPKHDQIIDCQKSLK
jgi:hypothetical protein